MDKVEIRLIRAPWYAGCELLIRQRVFGDEKRFAVAKNIVLEEVEPGTRIEPSLVLDDKGAQSLIDDLWGAGYRPTDGAGTAGSMAATQKHLEDMRKIVFKMIEEKI